MRLFYASLPEEPLREKLEELQKELQLPGRPTPRGRLHLTLLFLGEVAEEAVPPLKERTRRLLSALHPPEEPPLLRFDRIEHWLRAGVVCLVASQVPEPLLVLHRALKKAARGLELETRPFRPHVTLARKVSRRVPNRELCEPIFWPIREVVLVASELRPEGPRYHKIASWPCPSGKAPGVEIKRNPSG